MTTANTGGCLCTKYHYPGASHCYGKKIIIFVDGGEKREYLIGGYQKPIEGRVSCGAPLIHPLLGNKKDDIVDYVVNGKEVEVKILEITQGVKL